MSDIIKLEGIYMNKLLKKNYDFFFLISIMELLQELITYNKRYIDIICLNLFFK